MSRPVKDAFDNIPALFMVASFPDGSQRAFLTGLTHLYHLIPYQRRAKHAGQCGVEVEGGRLWSGLRRRGGDEYADPPVGEGAPEQDLTAVIVKAITPYIGW